MGVGKQLRQARESRGLTVRDIAERTKISSRQIDAIESERYEKLPGGIFGRGYVRALASALKLDPDACVEAYRRETEGENPTVPAAAAHGGPGGSAVRPTRPGPTPWRLEPSEPRMRLAAADDAPRPAARPEVVAAVLLGVCAILLILWLGRDRGSPPTSRVAPRVEAQAMAARTEGGQPIGTSGERNRAAALTPAGTDIRVDAERPCWLALTVDGERVAFRMLQAGESVHATMHASARLHAGDAGALTLSVGGSEARPVGGSGVVKTIDIAPAEARTP